MATKAKTFKRASKIPERIEAERKRRNWTYDEFAERVNARKTTVWGWCRREPSIRVLRRIADAFGCELSDLVDGTSAVAAKVG